MECINKSFASEDFLHFLKQANALLIFEKDDHLGKEKCRPINILLLFFKVHEK